MCGICGIIERRGESPERGVLERMVRILRHRGPDGEGVSIDAECGLGHSRLAVIDIPGGAQPMENEDGSIMAVFNGEIYNFRELRAGLEAAGHVFRSKSDTEVIVHLYEDEGAELVLKLRGMFAFAVWDRNAKRLTLALQATVARFEQRFGQLELDPGKRLEPDADGKKT